MKRTGEPGKLRKKPLDGGGPVLYNRAPLAPIISTTAAVAAEMSQGPLPVSHSQAMIQEVVISGAWQGFKDEVDQWVKAAKNVHLKVSPGPGIPGMVICASERPADLRRLQTWLREKVKAGQPERVVSFESAMFPPAREGGAPTLIRGLATRLERQVLEKLPRMASTPRRMAGRS